jgi:hypothetical protein
MEQPIPDVRRYRPDMPDAVAAALERALDRDPATRFESARHLGNAVLDAMAPTRPWTQGELGDFVRANFSDEIGKRSAQVATAIQRTNPVGGASRGSMPMLAQSEPPLDDDEDDLEFPPVDSIVVDEPRPAPGDFAGHTPPPFAGDSNPSGHSLQPIVAGQRPVVVVAKRSMLWPLVALVMVLIAAGALFLVWKQMQSPPPAVVNITTERTEPDTFAGPPPGSASAAAPPAGSNGSSKPAIGSAGPRPSTPSAPRNPYTEAIRTRQTAMNQCAVDHGRPPAGARVTIIVGTNGKMKSVSFEPASLDGTAFATCIRAALGPAAFPRAKDERTVSFTLT